MIFSRHPSFDGDSLRYEGKNGVVHAFAFRPDEEKLRRPLGETWGPYRDHTYLHLLLHAQRERLADGWLDAREVSTGDAGRLPELPPHTTPQDAAVWTIVARVLLNLDETISKN